MSSAPWKEFVGATLVIGDLLTSELSPEYVDQASTIENARTAITSENEMSSLLLLTSYRRFQATDLRDKVYAIFGIRIK
jgi:hypothetical protein